MGLEHFGRVSAARLVAVESRLTAAVLRPEDHSVPCEWKPSYASVYRPELEDLLSSPRSYPDELSLRFVDSQSNTPVHRECPRALYRMERPGAMVQPAAAPCVPGILSLGFNDEQTAAFETVMPHVLIVESGELIPSNKICTENSTSRMNKYPKRWETLEYFAR